MNYRCSIVDRWKGEQMKLTRRLIVLMIFLMLSSSLCFADTTDEKYNNLENSLNASINNDGGDLTITESLNLIDEKLKFEINLVKLKFSEYKYYLFVAIVLLIMFFYVFSFAFKLKSMQKNSLVVLFKVFILFVILIFIIPKFKIFF